MASLTARSISGSYGSGANWDARKSKRVKRVVPPLAPDPLIDQADQAFSDLKATCRSCHREFRERTEDGGYRIKPGG